ncbi:MAG: acyl-CoA thioesterase [Cyanobacteria bacterium SIG30]|nr:acyl-CoA thioesterase [Cyanobacteria bacterium SIG30]
MHKFETRVYWADTDTYGVAWHGTYLRWCEQARTAFCEDNGYNMKEIEKGGIALPVINIEIKYKKSARLHDNLIIETSVAPSKKISMTFKQVIKLKETDEVLSEANIEVVAVDVKTEKICRKMPFENLKNIN